MEWTNEISLQFLDIYQQEPIIWNPSHKLHKNRNEVYDASKRIQTEFSSEINFEISIDELKKKRNSLMATLRNCRSKLRSSEKSGAGTNEVYVPHWFAFAKMAGFLMNYDCPKKKTINSESIEEIQIVSQNIEVSETEYAETSDHYETDVMVTTEEKTSNTPAAKKKKVQTQERDDVIYDRMENAYKILKQKSIPKPITERSESAIYGELIGKKLEKMEQNERDYVMHQIDNVIYQAKKSFAENRYVITFPSTQVNPNSSQTSYATTPLPSTQVNSKYFQILHVSTPSPSPSNSESSVDTYTDGYRVKDYYTFIQSSSSFNKAEHTSGIIFEIT